MPTSRKRAKRGPALSGIPQRVLAMTPEHWPDARRAEWARTYIAGEKEKARTKRGIGESRRLDGVARAGRADERTAAEAHGLEDHDERVGERRRRHEDRRDAMEDGSLRSRIERLASAFGRFGRN